jgi:hypothetical protein
MSKFLNLIGKYNHILEAQGMPTEEPAGSEELANPPAPEIAPEVENEAGAEMNTPQQVSSTEDSALPTPNDNQTINDEPNVIQNFLNSLYDFILKNYNGEDKNEILKAMEGRGQMTKLDSILTALSTKLDPKKSTDTKQEIKNIKQTLNSVPMAGDE